MLFVPDAFVLFAFLSLSLCLSLLQVKVQTQTEKHGFSAGPVQVLKTPFDAAEITKVTPLFTECKGRMRGREQVLDSSF